MWDIIVGKPPADANRICSASTCRNAGDGYSISRNRISFWVSEPLLNVGMRVYVGSREHAQLQKMLNDPTTTDAKLQTWIDRLVLRKATIDQVLYGIRVQRKEAYRSGRRDAKAEIRAVLSSN
jgi:hypothetical protein